jgi:hypothetical protein
MKLLEASNVSQQQRYVPKRSSVAVGAAVGIALSSLTFPLLAAGSSNSIDRALKTPPFSGALSAAKAPIVDGPIAWSVNYSDVSRLLLGGLAGAGIGGFAGMVVMSGRYSRRPMDTIMLYATAGCLTGGALFYNAVSYDREVVFSTKVQEIVNASEPFYKRHNTGKTTTRSGPYYPQTLMIGESTIPLAANPKGVPFIAGQNINATFYLKNDGTVVSWSASSGVRD